MPQTGSNGAAQQARGVGNGKNVTQNHAFEHHGATAAGSVGSAGGSSEVVYVAEQSQGNGRPVYATAVGGGANGGGGETKESSNV
eukprot:gene20662-7584_t